MAAPSCQLTRRSMSSPLLAPPVAPPWQGDHDVVDAAAAPSETAAPPGTVCPASDTVPPPVPDVSELTAATLARAVRVLSHIFQFVAGEVWHVHRAGSDASGAVAELELASFHATRDVKLPQVTGYTRVPCAAC